MNFDRAGLPPNGTQALRQEPRTRFSRPAPVGATPFGDSPALAQGKVLSLGNETEKLNKAGQQVLPMS